MAINMKQFSVAVLQALHAPVNHQNVASLVGWEGAEGGAVHNNPFNTTEGGPAGTTVFNSVGVKSYPDFNSAVHATVTTLKNGDYGSIIGALKQSNPTAFVSAVGSSPWGTTGALLSETVKNALGTNFGIKGATAVKSVAKQRAGGASPGIPTTKVTAPTVTTKSSGGTVDWSGAITAALLAPKAINPSGALSSSDLLSTVLDNVGTGAYTSPVTNTVSSTGGGAVTTLKQVAQAKANAAKTVKGQVIKGPDPDLHQVGITTPKASWNPSDKPIADWIIPVLAWAKAHGWTGSVASGYRTDAEQTAIYDSGVRPAAVPRSLGGSGSNHEGNAFPAGAVDVSDAQQLSDILMKSPYAKLLVYAGAKDPVHFSHPHDGSY